MLRIHLLLIGFLLIAFTKLSAQTISLEQAAAHYSMGESIPNGVTHVSDLNGTRAPFLGTWIGTYNNVELTLVISISNFYSEINSINYDKLDFEYILKDSNGNLIEDSRTSDSSIYGYRYSIDGFYHFESRDSCGNKNSIYLRPEVPFNSTVLEKTVMVIWVLPPLIHALRTSPSDLNCTSLFDYIPRESIFLLNKQ